jgi:hypothetical protein
MKGNHKHGHAPAGKESKTYMVWKAMRQRCNNPRHADYPYYGGRGITVCERWNSFANFLADMGEQSPGLTLDRQNNDNGYSPDNCRWVTRATQAANRRNRYRSLHGNDE